MKSLFAIALFIGSAFAQGGMGPGPGMVHSVGAGNFTLVHSSPTSVGCSGSTTCSVTLSASLAASNLLTIQCMTASTVSISSISAGGTVVPVWSGTGVGNVNSFFAANGYVYPTSSTAGPIVITFSANMGTGSTCYLREYSVSAGTPKLDWAMERFNPFASVTSIPGLTPIFSGSNDVEIQEENNDQVGTTAVTGTGWTNGKFDATNGPGWADKQNSQTTTAPGWTISSSTGNASVSGMAFATDATACNDENFLNFEGGTATSNLDTPTLTSSTFGSLGGWGSAVGTPAASWKYQTAAQANLLTAYSSCDGHKTGSGTLGARFDVSASISYYFPYAWTPVGDVSAYGCWYTPHIATSDTGFYALLALGNLSGSDFSTVQLTSGQMYLETNLNPNGNPDAGTKFSYTQDAQYWVSAKLIKYVTPLTVATVAAASGGSTVYTGTITGGGSNALAGKSFLMYGFSNSANNGVFTASASSTTTLTVNNASGVVDTTGNATVTFNSLNIYDNTGALLSSQSKRANPTTPAQPNSFNFGRVGDSGTTATDYIQVDNCKVSVNPSAWPLLP